MNEELRAVIIAFLACLKREVLQQLLELIEHEIEARG